MIKQLTYISFLFFFLCLFSSCTIFSSDEDYSEDSTSEENYYAEGEDGDTTLKEEETTSPSDSDDESYPEDGEVEYIDEEDEDYLEEQPENIIVESEESEEPEESEGLEGSEESDDVLAPPTAETEEENTGFFSGGMGGEPDISSVKKNIPYKKIKGEPYQSAGFLVNAVYIARPGESIESISDKIFGSDQVSHLYAINPHLQSRTVKVGDKIYYSSPNRPQDSNQLLFYFEDKGIPATFHQVPAGGNIRTVAKQLLGHSNSWKEIWATNTDLQSKGVLDSDLTIRYWPANGEGEVTSPSAPPPSPQDMVQNEEQPMPDSPLGPGEEMEAEMPPEPPLDNADPSYGENNEKTPPMPPSDQNFSENSPSMGGEGEDQDKFLNLFSQTDMTAGAALAVIALICAFAIIKKRRKKKEFDYTAANFELDE